jgi:hypothetical protein
MSNIPKTNDHNPTTFVLHPYDEGPTLLEQNVLHP